MKNRECLLAHSPLFPRAADAAREKIDPFPGLTEKNDRMEILNVAPTPQGLAVQNLFAAVTAENAPQTVRGIYSVENKLLILNLKDLRLQYIVYDGTTFTQSHLSAETYQLDFDGSELIRSAICTEDGFPHVYESSPTKKMLFFPANVWAEAANGMPGTQHAMPENMPRLTVATVAGGRLYGVNGQTVYVSGGGGCFSWAFDEEGEQPDPSRAWKAVCATATEKQMPVVAVRGYKNCVLIFRKNALQKITGSGNPFTVKDLFRVGTSRADSICELNGEIYFASDNGFYRFNGSGLKRCELPDAQAVIGGPACVSDGRYCLYAEKNGEGYLYCYDPRTGTFGVTAAPGKITAFAQCADQTVALVTSGYSGRLYALSGDKSGVLSFVKIPLLPGEHEKTELESVTLRCTCRTANGALTVSLENEDDAGTVSTRQLAAYSGFSGANTARIRVRAKSLSRPVLVLNGTGDLLYESCEARFRKKPGRSSKS